MKVPFKIMTGFVFFFSILFTPQFCSSQLNAGFLNHSPIIDGLPDSFVINKLSPLRLSEIKKSEETDKEYIVQLRIGYNLEFLYLLLDINTDTIFYRDRAFQNGDGFHLTIAKPQMDYIASDEFYVLRFSPENLVRNEAAKIETWYYNVSLDGRPLSSEAILKTAVLNGKTYYECFIPWKLIHPYHPLVTLIGFNICFVKAIGEKNKDYYFLIYDPKMQSEQQKRLYKILSFGKSSETTGKQLYFSLNKNNCYEGDTVIASIYTISEKEEKSTINIYGYAGDGERVFYKSIPANFQIGLNKNEVRVPDYFLVNGGYYFNASNGNLKTNNSYLTILPKINFDDLLKNISKVKIAEGSRNTIKYQILDLKNQFANIKEYQTATFLRQQELRLLKSINEIGESHDLYKSKTGIFQRAFISAIDETLRPYSIKVPLDYSSLKQYPLLVFLHGSGEDDRGILSYMDLTAGNFIEIAPNGRGTSNCFATEEAQTDIDEAMKDAIKNYNIDTTKIIIGGFSMGGYGAYRTFYQHPKKYKAIVVFSGHPNLAQKWLGEGFPNFLEAKNLNEFKSVPVFIYHSENDRNCPYQLTLELIDKLKTIGSKIVVITTKDGGHSMLKDEFKTTYYEWLERIIN